MPIDYVFDDITRVKADAIVNSTNRYLEGRGTGLSGSIHLAAGPELQEELAEIGYCELGEAVITRSYNIKTCSFIIHTVAPKFYNWERNEKELLQSCYKNIFRLAEENECDSIALPILSAGYHGMPEEDAIDIQLECMRNYLRKNKKMVFHVVLFGKELTEIIKKRLSNSIDNNITDKYRRLNKALIRDFYLDGPDESVSLKVTLPGNEEEKPEYSQQDLCFAEMCHWWMKEHEIKPVHFYKRADIAKSSFSNLLNHPEAIPKKTTALKCCIALKLDYYEAKDLLERAGYCFSPYYDMDQIFEFYIRHRDYRIRKIREELEKAGLEIYTKEQERH